MLGRVQSRVVRNLEEGFALEFIHEQAADTLEEKRHGAIGRFTPGACCGPRALISAPDRWRCCHYAAT
jgi:hypothetical protein